MITIVSIILYALAILTASIMGFGMGRSKNRVIDGDTANAVIALAGATILFAVLASTLQVFA